MPRSVARPSPYADRVDATGYRRRVAAVLLAEALLAFGVVVWQVGGAALGSASAPLVAWGSAAYFLVLATVIVALAVLALRGVRWVFGPTVFLQILAVPMAVMMAGEGFWAGTVVLGGLAATGLVLLLSEQGREVFGRDSLGQG